MIDESEYEIGYGKPPQANKFVKGKSGNPNGRPKGSRNWAANILRDGRQPVRVNGPNGPRVITKQEAVITQIGNKAAQGDLPAARLYLALHQLAEAAQPGLESPELTSERDTSTKAGFRERLRLHGTRKPSMQDETKKEDSE